MLNFRYFDAWLKNTRDGTCNRSAISKFKPNAVRLSVKPYASPRVYHAPRWQLYSFCWRYIHMILQLNSIPPTPNLSMNLRREPLELPLSLIYRTHPRILWIFLGDLRPHSTPIIASLKNQVRISTSFLISYALHVRKDHSDVAIVPALRQEISAISTRSGSLITTI